VKSLPEQVNALRRELALRRSAYPGWVRSGRMTSAAADHEIACMESALATVEKVKMLEDVSEEMKAAARRMGAQVNAEKLSKGMEGIAG